ncbi:putative alpha-mannosidase [Myxococcus hansupus]|uniref:Putative alpha-mannosidase n=1 Tax=Pseudomyxococcus hansupus TaxID=1297742 RepID=A0A0H4WY14_9BACT|nr:alpha-mannosidase [Myxococcus hansupus]AKQ68301.1 putative alpha-mannosidase [Myxococcus hansupus]
MNSEQTLAQSLGIPEEATQVVVCEMAGHFDWDWQVPFLNYYQTGGGNHPPVQNSLESALNYMQDNSPAYRYSICEMSYLEKFVSGDSSRLAQLKAQGDQLSFSGAGITSAENLVTHGEAFIRNYLLGRRFVEQTFGPRKIQHLWIPDDFGSDSQLPIAVKAMGYDGAAFWRIPGDGAKIPSKDANELAPASLLHKQSVDFTWTARDGSAMTAHWLYAGYCQGNSKDGAPVTQSTLNGYANGPTAGKGRPFEFPTRYQFVPIDCDFEAPYPNLSSAIQTWNEKNRASGKWMLQASYQTYVALRDEALKRNGQRLTEHKRFVPNPYWTGCYASHPGLKQGHFSATRALLAAEPLVLILGKLQATVGREALTNGQTSDTAPYAQGGLGFWEGVASTLRRRLDEAWRLLTCSTHHDFVPGTAPDPVYRSEQRPQLAIAQAAAREVLDSSLRSVAQAIATRPQEGEQAFCVYNPVALQRSAPVELELAPWLTLTAARTSSQSGLAFQRVDATHWLVQVPDAPSLGYTSLYVTTAPFEPSKDLLPDLSPWTTGQDVVLSTRQVRVTLNGETGDIKSLHDLGTRPTTNLLPNAGNQLVFYNDQGGLYVFGMEAYGADSIGLTFAPLEPTSTSTRLQVLEQGALRQRVRAITTYALPLGSGSTAVTVVREYELLEGEPVLRMRTIGAAPSFTSVMARFGLGEAIQSLEHGTALYWDDNRPRLYFKASKYNPASTQMTFEATHGFVQARGHDGGRALGFLHAATPAWAIENPASMLGGDAQPAGNDSTHVVACLMRNTPATGGNGASGSDAASHCVEYAVVVPSGLTAPSTGGPQRNAALYNGPLIAQAVPVDPAGTSPESLSLVSTEGSILVTAVKPGTNAPEQAVLRVLQLGAPDNGTLPQVQVTLGSELASAYQQGGPVVAGLQSALEKELDTPPTVTVDGATVSWTPDCAVSTLVLST